MAVGFTVHRWHRTSGRRRRDQSRIAIRPVVQREAKQPAADPRRLRFRVDERFDEAERIDKLLRSPDVARDLKDDPEEP